MMQDLYPLKFHPQYKEKIWGGRKMAETLDKSLPEGKIGESWEISAVDGSISIVKEGSLSGERLDNLIQKFGSKLLGSKVSEKYDEEFPLLIKFLDAQDDLSIQVHPDDELAQKRHNSFGKSEMWYILQSEENAKLNKGFNEVLDAEEYLARVRDNQLDEVLQNGIVAEGDVFNIPAGTIHNIGKGILLAEIQQSSDVTYRIHDFGRTDDQGNLRELHVDESVEALNFQQEKYFSIHPEVQLNEPIVLVESENFITRRFTLNQTFEIDYPNANSFRIFICTKGEAVISGNFESVSIKKGESVLISANIPALAIETSGLFEMLETQIP